MFRSKRTTLFFTAVAVVTGGMQGVPGSAARELNPLPALLDSWEARPLSNSTTECVPSPIWSREVDTSTYEFGCEDIEAMMNGEAKLVSHGSVRQVFLAEYQGRSLVVKRVNPSWHDLPESQRRRTQRFARQEILALDAVRGNPNVVGMLGVCNMDFVAEYLPSELSQFLGNQNKDGNEIPFIQTVRLALGSARGLRALHEAPGGPIVHFDIKASQFLVDEDGVTKIDDLNMAWFMARDAASADGKQCPFTTGRRKHHLRNSLYGAPERVSSEPLTEKVDIYGLGIIFYQLLSTKRAKCNRECKLNSPYSLVPPGLEVDPAWPTVFVEIMEDMWRRNPDERASAGEVVSRLEALLELLSE